MMKDTVRDINGSVFAALFDDEMNDGAEAYAIQSPKSSALAFASKERLLKFIEDNKDVYKIVSASGKTIKVDSIEDGMRLTISPLNVDKVKGKELSGIISAIDAKDEDASVVEIKSMALKECLEIISAIKENRLDDVGRLVEELIIDSVNTNIELTECELAGIDIVDYLEERFRIKVNAKGKRSRKLICKKGYKVGNGGRSCVRITAKEKITRRKAMRKALRTKKSKGAGLLRKTLIKRKRALRKRNSMGL